MSLFKECPECAKKPGSPELCESCLHNRRMIGGLVNACDKGTDALLFIASVLEEGTAKGRPMDLILKGAWDKWYAKCEEFKKVTREIRGT